MPGSYFLMNNTKESDQDLDDLELDDFDEFVIIEREDLKQKLQDLNEAHNDPEKLKNEEARLVEGPAEKLVDNGPANKGDKELTLADFKIKKVLDKGSFGKVFLVVNTQDNEEYAMKRINKNVLIEKGQIINTRTEKDILI